MKRFFLLFQTFGILIFLGLSVASAQSQPVFRIGVLDEERGPLSDGARLAVREINEAGGVRGADGTFFRLELVIAPTGNGAAIGSAAAVVGQASVIAVIGPSSNAEVANNLPILQGLQVPVLTPATGDTLLTGDGTGRIIRIRAAEVHQGRALAQYLVSELQARQISTVQLELDIDSTASIVGFSTAASALGVLPQPALQAQNDQSIPQIVNQLISTNSPYVVAYGPAARAAALYNSLRQNGWTGTFAYNQVDAAAFRENVPFDQLRGIIATTTWPFTAADAASDDFRDNFIRAYGEVPGALEAASYDAVTLLAAAIGQPGDLLSNLTRLDNIAGVQGALRPARLTRGETGTNAAVVKLGDFGAPEVLARYEGGQKLADVTQPIPTATAAPTATPAGVVITIKQARQNVRSGPSTNYPVLGQLSEGDQAQVIGATIDLSWVVIDYRGQQGWLATYLLDVFGNLNTVPIITPPPTPTPPPTSTALPFADVVIDAVSVVPSPIIVNQPFTVSVSVRNAGNVPAGQFAIAATFPPNNIYSAVTIPGLGAGQSTIATLSGTFTNTGFYSVAIVADLNNQLAEGPGENNNIFNFSYAINKPILRSAAQTLNPGDTLDLEGNGVQGDVNWNVSGQQLDALGSAKLGVIPNVTLENIHWDLINPSVVNQTTVTRLAMNAGTIIGVITADGNRGAIRVDDIPGNQFKITFIVYQN